MTHGFLEACDDDLFERRPVALMELFVLLARHEQLLECRASTIRLIRDNLHLVDDKFRADPQARQYFFELFCQPSGVYTQLATYESLWNSCGIHSRFCTYCGPYAI